MNRSIALIALLMGWSTACVATVGDEASEDVEAESSALSAAAAPTPTVGKVQAYLAYLQRSGQGAGGGVSAQRAAAPGGFAEPIEQYAAKCDIATGVHVPAFSCENGTEVPGQGNGSVCPKPNVLNNDCDVGSKFQVLVRTPDAIVVGHCRKVNHADKHDTLYEDIAVIQYNKRNGAQCFYQALITGGVPLNGAAVTAPSAGANAGFPWLTPQVTEGINCTGCHDNGGLIRSPYLAQLTSGKDAFPNSADGFDNNTIPVKYVGLDFALNRSWSITGPTVVGTGAPCNSCHRLAVSNYRAFGRVNGTAGHFATQSTQLVQSSATTTTVIGGVTQSTPRWMRPGQAAFDANALASAQKFEDCANGYWFGQSDGFQSGTATAGCTFTPLAKPWDGTSPATISVTVLSPALL